MGYSDDMKLFSYIENFNAYNLINTDFSQDDIFCIVLSIIPQLEYFYLFLLTNQDFATI